MIRDNRHSENSPSSEQLFSVALSATKTLSSQEEETMTRAIDEAREQVTAILAQFSETAAVLGGVDPATANGDREFREQAALAISRAGRELLEKRRLPANFGMRRPVLRGWLGDLDAALADYRGLRDRMLRANVRLVSMLARRYPGSALSYLDLVQEGSIGLLRAIEKFQPSRNVRFSTYATWWIWQALSRAADTQGSLIRTPVHWGQLRRRIARGDTGRIDEEGRPLSRDKLASAEGLERGRFDEMTSTFGFVSTDAPLREGDDRSLESMLPGNVMEPMEYAEQSALRTLLDDALAHLPKREEFILRQRFGLEGDLTRSLEELGRELCVSRERVRQLEVRALNKLKDSPVGSALADYLQ